LEAPVRVIPTSIGSIARVSVERYKTAASTRTSTANLVHTEAIQERSCTNA